MKKKSEIDWKKREESLFHFLEKYRKNNGDYDCIVPSSGGKDSSLTAHILKTKYNMNPLAVTWAPFIFRPRVSQARRPCPQSSP